MQFQKSSAAISLFHHFQNLVFTLLSYRLSFNAVRHALLYLMDCCCDTAPNHTNGAQLACSLAACLSKQYMIQVVLAV